MYSIDSIITIIITNFSNTIINSLIDINTFDINTFIITRDTIRVIVIQFVL